MGCQSPSEAKQHIDSRGACAPDPIDEKLVSLLLAALTPKSSQVLFHVVGGRQRFVEFQRFFQPLLFVSALVEVFRVFEQQPADPFYNVLISLLVGFSEQRSAQVRKLIVEQLDDMKVIKDRGGVGQVFPHRTDIGRRHVDGDGFNPCFGGFEPPPEGLQGFGPLAVTDKNHHSASQVHHHCQISVSLTDRDLIDGDSSQVFQFGAAEAPGQMPFLNILDHVPAHIQMQGNVLDGHKTAQIQSIAFELAGVSSPGVGKANRHLPEALTGQAKNSLNGQHDFDRFSNNGRGGKLPLDATLADNLSRVAFRAATVCFSLPNPENHLATVILSVDILVATDTEDVVQKARGHEGFLSSLKSGDDNEESLIVHFFSTPRYAYSG